MITLCKNCGWPRFEHGTPRPVGQCPWAEPCPSGMAREQGKRFEPKKPMEYSVKCPRCGVMVDLPDNEPDDPFKVVGCLECGVTFDYDESQVEAKGGA